MNRNRLFATLLIVLVVVGFFGYIANPYGASLFGKQFLFRLGLDLQGGTHLVYRGELADIASSDHESAMNAVRDVIERRVNAFGVSEPVVQVSGEDRLIIELPGVKDIDAAINLIGQTPFLEFREENPDYVTPQDPNQIDPKELFSKTKLTGAQLQRAEVTFAGSQQAFNTPEVTLTFNDEGKQLFADITRRNIQRRIAIFLDGELLSAPVVQTAITDGRAVITGSFTLDQAKQLATRLNSGALPVPIQLLSQQNVGPSLGKAYVNQSVMAGLIGIAVVALFMIAYYGFPGFIAVLALLIYTIVSLGIFKLFNVTLTLAGIAGFILSIGMAIDANILIFERTKEELRRGKSLQLAVEDGFKRAWTSIRDSNVSSLITTFVLGYFGSSIIRGFAITLSIGILVSLFSAITVTRTFLRLILMIKFLDTPRLFGIKRV
ncbi:MAG: protein-export membrane protein SecD [Candidatus Doudnabacteria bacterium RIFCSPHIGHO2_01_FULL_50_11]|uniref:Protein translocase subunit SecD n=1 Tax=Candidatus Doudnabacteria bacterium RIFCSPHIGHO2_01_FULL_50_11 TaxID=1817828 RepID=A0A1F5PMI4_9BACT|nr:MAG: protein-export membrane protein SecD [Candidatus Doudnabacteria bacterium RIFCSPHIGHO2_01_FULL_50_11]HLC44745.1 protein translocase subunit SecD [Patescibacteria group bacterium]